MSKTKQRKSTKSKKRIDIIRGTYIDDWVLGLILVGIPFSVGMWLVVSTAKEWFVEIFPTGESDVLTFVFGLTMLLFSVWLGRKFRLEKPSP